MMTREQYMKDLMTADDVFEQEEMSVWAKNIAAHDAEQRQMIEKARRPAEYWKAEHLAGNKKIEQQAKEITLLREALQLLYDHQNGCPLPKYEKDWNRAMVLTQQALKEQP